MYGSRIYIRYDEDGGSTKDGVIELRKGVDDISLGNSTYAQVRVAVDDKYFLKGMAVYSNDIPKGYDVLVNSNKPKGTPPDKVFKEMKTKVNPETGEKEIDWDNPFGALVKQSKVDEATGLLKGGQYEYIGKDGKKHLSAINKLKEEGDWNNFSKTLSSQFLSKQPLQLINKQLDLSMKDKLSEFEAIQQIKQPELKKKLLISFAEECDKAAVDLKAAPVPGQSSKVILPSNDISDKEVYAPTYSTGHLLVRTSAFLVNVVSAVFSVYTVLCVHSNTAVPRATAPYARVDVSAFYRLCIIESIFIA